MSKMVTLVVSSSVSESISYCSQKGMEQTEIPTEFVHNGKLVKAASVYFLGAIRTDEIIVVGDCELTENFFHRIMPQTQVRVETRW